MTFDPAVDQETGASGWRYQDINLTVDEWAINYKKKKKKGRTMEKAAQQNEKRSAAIIRGTGGQYVAVCSVSNSPLTHNPFTTLSNKVWEVYFSKEVCLSSLLIMFLHVYVYV